MPLTAKTATTLTDAAAPKSWAAPVGRAATAGRRSMPPTAVMPLMALVADMSGEWSAGGTPSTAWQGRWSARQGRVEYALGRVGLAGRKQGLGKL